MDIPDIAAVIVSHCTIPVKAQLAQTNTLCRDAVYRWYRDAIMLGELVDEPPPSAHGSSSVEYTLVAGIAQLLYLRIYRHPQRLYHDVEIFTNDVGCVVFDIKNTTTTNVVYNRVTPSLHICTNHLVLMKQLPRLCPPAFVGGVIHRICREWWIPDFIDPRFLPGAELVPQN